MDMEVLSAELAADPLGLGRAAPDDAPRADLPNRVGNNISFTAA